MKNDPYHYRFSFTPVDQKQRALIHSWLSQDYVHEWLYGEGLKWTLDDLDKFFEGSSFFQHWISYENGVPFAYLLTASAEHDANDPFCRWCSKEGTTISLDVIVGDTRFLGKGLSHTLIQEFLLSEFSGIDEVLIDPDSQNIRAIRAYQKTGFQIIGSFVPANNLLPHTMMRLRINELREKFRDRTVT